VAEDKKLARQLVEMDLAKTAQALRKHGIGPEAILQPDDVVEDDPDTVIEVIIGHRGRLTDRQAKEAAEHWKSIHARYQRTRIMTAIAGYDEDPREIWEFPEVCRFMQRWAKYSGLADPKVALREIGDQTRFFSLLALLTACGTYRAFGNDLPFEVRIATPPVTRQ